MKAVIVNPSRILGGTEFVYLLLAEQLAADGVQVTIVDFTNGWTAGASIVPRIRASAILVISPMQNTWGLESAAIVLCSAKFVALVIRQGRSEGIEVVAKLMAWLVHPLELYSNNFRSVKRFGKILNLVPSAMSRLSIWLSAYTGYSIKLRRLIASDRLHAMDETTLLSISSQFPDLLPSIFPVPGSVGDESTHDARPVSNWSGPISIVWISRLDGFKLPPLIKLLNELARTPSLAQRGVLVRIIGDGDGLLRVREVAKNLPEFVKTEFKGFMQSGELRHFLTTQPIDLAVGMGTALSLCAAHGVASVIATAADDMAEYSHGGEAFRFLGSRGSYSLGEYQNAKPACFRYVALQRILAHATAFPSIGKAQKKWYQKTYGKALPNYVAKIHALANDDSPVVASSPVSTVFARFSQNLLLKFFYKNAAFPP